MEDTNSLSRNVCFNLEGLEAMYVFKNRTYHDSALLRPRGIKVQGQTM